MNTPDLDRIRSEKPLSRQDFVLEYNKDLPEGFPNVTASLLADFRKSHPSLFKDASWSLAAHRKRVMDWLPLHVSSL